MEKKKNFVRQFQIIFFERRNSLKLADNEVGWAVNY